MYKVHTGIKNAIRDVLNWISDIIKCIRDITNSNSWYVGLQLWDCESRSWSSASVFVTNVSERSCDQLL